MRSAILYQYSLPMDSGIILRDKRLTHREGLVVALSDRGKTALGEIAPLIGFSHENLADATNQAQTAAYEWTKGNSLLLEALYPSVAFGLSVAMHDLDNKLPKEGNFKVAPLCTGDPDELVEKLKNRSSEKVAKVKVGLYEAIRDAILVNMLLEAVPDLYLRLDANQQWTITKALQFANKISPPLRSRICFIEEPCKTMRESLDFAKQTNIPIAWDETSRLPDFNLEAQQGVVAVIIKPSLVGSIEKVANLVSTAHQLGLQAIISSSLESSLGLTHLARLANLLTPDMISGLDTVDMFAAQLEVPWPSSSLSLQKLVHCGVVWQSS